MLSLDPQVGDFDTADVLIDGPKIAAVGPNLTATSAASAGSTSRRRINVLPFNSASGAVVLAMDTSNVDTV